MIDNKLQKLKNVRDGLCVTIILNTHRTAPGNRKDPVLLKNLIREAEQRLLERGGVREVRKLIESLHALAEKVDHSHNLESLILFVSSDIAEFARLPVVVSERVVIDDNFATRDLVRAMHGLMRYYVLVLSQQEARLIEALNDAVAGEAGSPFPMTNTRYFPGSRAEAANASRQTSLLAEFFNTVDKGLNVIRKDNDFPVLVCSEESNFYEYLKVADRRESICEKHLNGNRIADKAHAIVRDAWPVMEAHGRAVNRERREELMKAVGTGRFLSDIGEIWRAIPEGRVKTLFIEQGLFMPALIRGKSITLLTDGDKHTDGAVDDIFDELIEANMRHGGDVVFLPPGALADFEGFAAVTRF